MKFVKQSLLAAAAVLAVAGAHATVVGSLGSGGGAPATLTGPGTPNSGGVLTGTVSGTISGGQVLTGSLPPVADGVEGTTSYLSSGPFSGTATLTFTPSVTFVSFLWGSPDTYNTLHVFSDAGVMDQVFTTAFFGIPGDGNQATNQPVSFTATAGHITSLRFDSSQNAFETGNFRTTAAIPEPETYALMLAGLGVVGFMAKRRRR